MSILDALTPDDLRRLRGIILSDPIDFPPAFKDWVPNWTGLSGLDIPFSQITGAPLFVPQPAPTVQTSETTSSTSATNLATVGPTLTGLPDGQYLVQFGCAAKNSMAGKTAGMYYQVNASAVDGNEVAFSTTTDDMSVSRSSIVTLASGGNNTITAKYAVNDGATTGTFRYRWLIAIRVANA